MDHKELRIVFMGTPEFAVASLDMLVSTGCNVVGVITAPDKPAGRGMQLNESPVKKYALSKGLYILQPEKLKEPSFIEELRSLNADLQAVVAFRMLPDIVWSMPKMGTINVHGSLLPKYRGAAPINWAIINGEEYTGVTTFKLQHEIDTGNILLSKSIRIEEHDNAGSIHDKLKKVGAQLLLETIRGIASGNLAEVPQDATQPILHAPKIFRETGMINWSKSTKQVNDLIRGLSPTPGAYTLLHGKMIKIFRAEASSDNIPPGEYHTDQKTFLGFGTGDGSLLVKELQPEGKKRMQITDFLRGYHFPA